MVDLHQYFQDLQDTASTGDTREESFYGDLSRLLGEYAEENDYSDAQVTTLPSRTEAGNPDFRIWKGASEVIGYIEAKDPGTSSKELDRIEKSEQLMRYRETFENIILTNFTEFRLYRQGEPIANVEIADPPEIKLFGSTPDVVNSGDFDDLLKRFYTHSHPGVSSARELAIELATRTSFMRRVVLQELSELEDEDGNIYGFYQAFQEYLMPDLSEKEFADIYSQTITYGLLAARTRVPGEFDRTQAASAIPATIGILRDIFEFISGGDRLPGEIEWAVDEVSYILSSSDVDKILSDFYEERAESHPLIHFYETFLEEYDPMTRQQKGVYYTPEPVVSWITNSVNTILKQNLNRADGLADESVTILDPAAGTMGFPAAAMSIAVQEFSDKYGTGGVSTLLSDHILQNYYAFEILVAAYTIGHLKMAILLEDHGYELSDDDRVKLFLTNTLEPEEVKQTTLPIASSIAEESEKAHEVKEETPILAILGNPPYSGHSENQGEWIKSLVDDYIEGYPDLQKRGQAKWLSDDYVKFIRWAQWKLADADEGTLGYITNHGYIDNPTFHGMREQLLLEFDEIYILDLHGNVNRREEPPGGGIDENVFGSIRQGVAISIFVKEDDESKDEYADVHHSDLWGTRNEKYEALKDSDITDISWQEITPREPLFLFVPRDLELADIYHDWVSVPSIFSKYGDPAPGIVTTHNQFAISLTPDRQKAKVQQLLDTDNEKEARKYFNLCSQDQWQYDAAKEHLSRVDWEDKIVEIQTQPFDKQHTVYDEHVAVHRRAERLSRHMLAGENISISVPRRTERTPFDHAFVTDGLMTHHSVSTKEVNYQFPLYLYPNAPAETYSRLENTERDTNVSDRLLTQLSNVYSDPVSAEDVFYYTYAILYTPTYRLKYSEFMESDFPKIPFPEEEELFDEIATLGKDLTDWHLLKHPDLESPEVYFKGDGGNEVSERTGDSYRHYDAESQRFFVNSGQYFEPVPVEVWEYEIGDRQILKKWIQERIGGKLSLSEIQKFCRIVRAVKETIEIQEDLESRFEAVEGSYLSLSLEVQQTLDT